MRNPNEAGNRFARNGIIFAIIVLVIIIFFYGYLHFGPANEAKAPNVPSTPAHEAQTTDTSTKTCQAGEVAPKALNPIADYVIIAGSVAMITAGPTFDGKELEFAMAAKPTNPKNRVTINANTGTVRIQAEYKDNFDVTVVAKNPCGAASTMFNVQIDEKK